MKYACLIYGDESDKASNPDQDTAEFGAMMAGYEAFGEEFGDKIAGGEALEPVATATSVRVSNGETMTTDGPFAETKEQLGGFYVVEAADLDEAVAMASKIPHAALGTIEVRPCINFE